jgi:hypothetical protein
MATPDKPRRCPNCGTEVAVVDTICWRCYRRLPPLPRPQPTPVRRRRRRSVPASTLIAALLVTGLGGYLWYVRCSPTAALTAFLRADASGDVKAMYELLSMRSRDMLGPEILAERAAAAHPPFSFVVRSIKRDDTSAEITLGAVPTEAGANPDATTWRVYMVWEQGRWRVDMVRMGQEAIGGDTPVSPRDLRRLWKTGLGRP